MSINCNSKYVSVTLRAHVIVTLRSKNQKATSHIPQNKEMICDA